jgi:CNT family concentrative nucleoside transporter
VAVGGLIGEKVVTNEFVAYVHLNEIKESLSPRAVIISTYALCGFANFASIAIQIGGIGGLAPNRRPDLARLGLLSVLGGTLATMMTATIAGVLTSFAG